MKKVILYAAVLTAGLSLSACHDDPNYDHVTPPTVEVAPSAISGIVTDMQGNPVAGATVTIGGYTATTDANGVYTISGITPGNYEAKVVADGMIPVSGTIVIATSHNTQNISWNPMLAKRISTDFNVTVDEGGEGTVKSEALSFNNEGHVDIDLSVPVEAVPEDVTVTISPIYTSESASVAGRAPQETLLIGATISCSDPNVKLSRDIDLTFNLDESVAASVTTKKYVNGQWVDAPSSVTDGNVVISANDFTSYGVFLSVNVATKISTQPITFAQSEWNNLYGSSDIFVENATYTYKVGTEVTTRAANKLQGLLIEHLARLFGATTHQMNGSYPINTTLPIGTALTIKGAQEIMDITVTGNHSSVNGKSYGTTNVGVSVYNRDHLGGGSGD